jgi:hypothetical protein
MKNNTASLAEPLARAAPSPPRSRSRSRGPLSTGGAPTPDWCGCGCRRHPVCRGEGDDARRCEHGRDRKHRRKAEEMMTGGRISDGRAPHAVHPASSHNPKNRTPNSPHRAPVRVAFRGTVCALPAAAAAASSQDGVVERCHAGERNKRSQNRKTRTNTQSCVRVCDV